MRRNLHFLADLWNLAHLLPSIKLMIIARKKNHIQDNHTINRHLAQAERSHLGEEDPRSGELPSPRRELDFQYENPARVLTQARPSSPKRDVRSPKQYTINTVHAQTITQIMPYTHSHIFSRKTQNTIKTTINAPDKEGSSFPYLEVARRCLDSNQRSMATQGGDLRAE
ncbi:hypothetical protein DEO72_LG11g2126 [Vigna unguiculata]|uniref:Uncharacterized protein n=1 Tax=Vigna unguiculata TaxID=3917 RepID=A0A4D6NP72_VIGUN|nr:hypothetical protein DEO72_LG11g2126 [Vigna unguiculata]